MDSAEKVREIATSVPMSVAAHASLVTAAEEIKSLRSDADQSHKRIIECCKKHRDAMEIIKDERERGDEWKRRARLVVTWVANQIPPGCSLHLDKYFLKDNPEAAEWFKTE